MKLASSSRDSYKQPKKCFYFVLFYVLSSQYVNTTKQIPKYLSSDSSTNFSKNNFRSHSSTQRPVVLSTDCPIPCLPNIFLH